MDLRKTFGTDAALEADGIDVHLGGDAYVTLARAGGGNLRYEAAMRRVFAPHRRALQSGTLDEKTATDILQQVYAESVILGWRGMELDGAELPHSYENARRVLKEFPEIWRIVQEEAAKFSNFRQEEAKEMGKVLPMR